MPPTHELAIPVHDLDAAGKEVHFRLRAPWLRTVLAEGPGQPDVAVLGDGELDVRVSKSGADVVVHGTLKAELRVPCARCLEPAAVHIDQPVTVLAVATHKMRSHGGGDEERELSDEEADTLPFDGDTVVLDDFVRDELVLAIPMIPLCSEDCPGISPPNLVEERERAAEKPAIDPRLAPLLKLKKDRQE